MSWKCSKCEYEVSHWPEDSVMDRYCPECGELVKGSGKWKEPEKYSVVILLFIGINLFGLSCLISTFLYGPIRGMEYPSYVLYDQEGRSLGEFGVASAILRYMASFIDQQTRISAPFEIDIFFYIDLFLSFVMSIIVGNYLIDSRDTTSSSIIKYVVVISSLFGLIFMSIVIGPTPYVFLVVFIIWLFGGVEYWHTFIREDDDDYKKEQRRVQKQVEDKRRIQEQIEYERNEIEELRKGSEDVVKRRLEEIRKD